jgi:hypothetical protein
MIHAPQPSVVSAIAQPILAIDVGPPTKGDRQPTLHSAAASSVNADSTAQSTNENPEPFLSSPSVHPLAALGIRNQPPRIVSEPATTAATEAEPASVTAPVATNASETPDFATQQCSIEKHFVTPSSNEAAPPSAGQLDSPMNVVSQDDTLKGAIGDLVARFGSDFEAQVRELAAQRVAQMVAERFMAAFDTSSLAVSTKRSARHSSIAAPQEPKVTTAHQELNVTTAPQELRVTTRPGRKKRRAE